MRCGRKRDMVMYKRLTPSASLSSGAQSISDFLNLKPPSFYFFYNREKSNLQQNVKSPAWCRTTKIKKFRRFESKCSRYQHYFFFSIKVTSRFYRIEGFDSVWCFFPYSSHLLFWLQFSCEMVIDWLLLSLQLISLLDCSKWQIFCLSSVSFLLSNLFMIGKEFSPCEMNSSNSVI